MVELYVMRVYELTIIIYALSILLYFKDFLHNNRKANHLAFWLLAIVWFLQTIFLFLRLIETGRLPILTISEGLYFYTWILITLSLIINRLLKLEFIVFFTNVIGFFLMALHTFAPVEHNSLLVTEKLISELLMIHITMSFLAYGAFSVSFVFSILYLIQYKLLKKKKWGKRLLRIGDLTKLDQLSFVMNIIGVPILLLGLLLGVIWAYIKIPNFHWYDIKVVGSYSVLVFYSLYLYKKTALQIQGKAIALWNIGSFFVLLINYFLFGSLSRFHFWYS